MTSFTEAWGLKIEGAEFSCQSPDGTLQVTGAVSRSERGIVISRMEWSTEHPIGIFAKTHRDFPMVELIACLRAAVMPDQPEISIEADENGRTALTDDHLRQVALAYLAETGPGQPRGAARRLAQRYGRPETTIHRWVLLARQRGWLEQTWQGRRGAEPGPRLLEGGGQ